VYIDMGIKLEHQGLGGKFFEHRQHTQVITSQPKDEGVALEGLAAPAPAALAPGPAMLRLGKGQLLDMEAVPEGMRAAGLLLPLGITAYFPHDIGQGYCPLRSSRSAELVPGKDPHR
jgi:hypothetical protein